MHKNNKENIVIISIDYICDISYHISTTLNKKNDEKNDCTYMISEII